MEAQTLLHRAHLPENSCFVNTGGRKKSFDVR